MAPNKLAPPSRGGLRTTMSRNRWTLGNANPSYVAPSCVPCGQANGIVYSWCQVFLRGSKECSAAHCVAPPVSKDDDPVVYCLSRHRPRKKKLRSRHRPRRLARRKVEGGGLNCGTGCGKTPLRLESRLANRVDVPRLRECDNPRKYPKHRAETLSTHPPVEGLPANGAAPGRTGTQEGSRKTTT